MAHTAENVATRACASRTWRGGVLPGRLLVCIALYFILEGRSQGAPSGPAEAPQPPTAAWQAAPRPLDPLAPSDPDADREQPVRPPQPQPAPQVIVDEEHPPGLRERRSSSDARPVKPRRMGFQRAGSYFHLSPGIFALDLLTPEVRMFSWGVSGGSHFTPREDRAVMLGGFFEHLVRPIDPTTSFRMGMEVRVGRSREQLFFYGLGRIGLNIAHVKTNASIGPRVAHPAFIMISLGFGLQVAIGSQRRFLLGIEPALDLSWPGTLLDFRVRAFGGWHF